MSEAPVPVDSVSDVKATIPPARYQAITRLALWSLVAIVITGAAVRLTGSGLGCSDWPKCSSERFVPEREFHGLVEFVNRMFTGVVSLAVIFAVLALTASRLLGRSDQAADGSDRVLPIQDSYSVA